MYYSLVKSSNPRIVIILPALGIGGVEHFVSRLMGQMSNDFSFLLVVLKDEKREMIMTKNENIEVIRLHLFQTFNPFKFIRKIWFVRRSILKINPVAIQCFLYPAELFSILLGKTIPIYWSVRGTGNPLEKSILRQFLIRLDIFLANFFPKSIVACSEAARKWAISEGINPGKILVIHNFLDDWTETCRSKSKLLKDSFSERRSGLRIGMAARVDPHKGHYPLMNAVLKAVEVSDVPMTLSFIGTGTNTICLPKEIASHKAFINGNFVIEFLGPIIDVNVKARWFSNLDVYVMASHNLEGFPNSLFEAIAIGCPYISSTSGNVSEFLNPKYLYQNPTPDFISSRLLLLTNTPAKELINDILETQGKLKIAANRLAVCNSYNNLWLN